MDLDFTYIGEANLGAEIIQYHNFILIMLLLISFLIVFE